jgi:hypothetical protein
VSAGGSEQNALAVLGDAGRVDIGRAGSPFSIGSVIKNKPPHSATAPYVPSTIFKIPLDRRRVGHIFDVR